MDRHLLGIETVDIVLCGGVHFTLLSVVDGLTDVKGDRGLGRLMVSFAWHFSVSANPNVLVDDSPHKAKSN